MQKYNIIELNEKELPDLQKIAEELGISKVSELDKQALVYRILDEQAIVLAEENKKEPKKPEGRKRGRPAKAKGTPEKPAEGEPVAAAEQPVEVEKAVETPEPAQPKPSKKRKTRVAAVPVVTVDPNQPVTEPIPEPMPALRDKEEPQAPQGKVEQPLLNEPAAVEVKEEFAQPEEELVFSDTLVTAEVEPMAAAGAPEEKAVEEDRRRLVFRHPDAKSVLDQILPIQPAKTEPKQQPQNKNNNNNNSNNNNPNAAPNNGNAANAQPQEKAYDFDGILTGTGVL